MLQKIINLVFSALGGNAIGTEVYFPSGEGPYSQKLIGQKGVVARVERNKKNIKEIIYISLGEELDLEGMKIGEVGLIPRHVDYGSEALGNTTISTYVFPVPTHGVADFADEKKMLAMMDVRKKR